MTGQVVSLFGDFFALFAVMEWLAFRRHAGASAVTMVTFWALLPTAVFSPVAGALVDRWDAKKTLIASDIGRAALIAVLLWANSLTAIYAVFVGLGLWSSVFQPARAVLIKTLVADEELIAANGMLQQALLLVRIVAMPIGALLTASLGTRACYLADIASFMVSAAAILSIRRVHRPRDKRPGQAALRSEIGEGLRFLLGRPALCRIIVCLGIALFIATAMTPLLAIYVR
ncbi:MAG TPA: MFS transporter, partial [Candidatus Sulfopaludibacter sp.]|nr:MFS transporter [Candidatus Sulfopaludibacter sp.]